MGRTVRLLGVPTDFGTNRRGVDMGPSAIRYAGLAGQLDAAGVDCVDVGNVEAPVVEAAGAENPGGEHTAGGPVRALEAVKSVCTQLADEVATALDAGQFPLAIGGDHSLSIGTIAGTARDANVGVLWFDAHGDFNTPETSTSGNVHGMPLAAALGHGSFAKEPWAQAEGLQEQNVVWVGLRDVDPGERKRIRDSKAAAFTMADVDRHGIGDVIDDAISVAGDGVDGIHVSLDLDWLEPTEAPGVGTPVAGGATYREAHLALEMLAERDRELGLVRSMDVVEVNPILDDRNKTARLATELVASGLGKRIL